jgi:mono/diheme cytochrome c family protein
MDLVAYLESLGRERDLAWPEGDRRARQLTQDERALMSLKAEVLNAHPAMTRPRGDAPVLPAITNTDYGQSLWRDNCSGCHGSDGRGDGPAASWLQPAPVNLTEHRYRADLLADILWNGVYGSSMPAWRDMNPEQLAALVAVVDSFSEVNTDPGAPTAIGQGRLVYQTHCAECHGDDGDGNGFAASNLPIPIMPTDFTRDLLSEAAILRTLQEGVVGTSMAPWGDRLSEAEMNAVGQFIRSLFRDGNELASGGINND